MHCSLYHFISNSESCGEKGTAAVPALANPAPLGGALVLATDSGGGAPRTLGETQGGMPGRDLGSGTGRGKEETGGDEREKQLTGIRRLLGTPPSGPLPIGWPGLATLGGGTGSTLLSSSRSRICSTSPPPANSHLQQVSQSCLASTKGRPLLLRSSD